MSWVWAFAFISLGAVVGLVSLALVTTKRLPREEDEWPEWWQYPLRPRDPVTMREFGRVMSAPRHERADPAKRRARKAQRKARRKQRGR